VHQTVHPDLDLARHTLHSSSIGIVERQPSETSRRLEDSAYGGRASPSTFLNES
jgi:hypothetical protein